MIIKQLKSAFIHNSVFLIFLITLLCSLAPSRSFAQEDYEIQVYPSQTIGKGYTMVELHSNTSFRGQGIIDGVRPTQNAFRETLEITHGFTSNFELGFYQFINIQSRFGAQWVGTHIRPRISIPEEWNWPLGISLSTEVGYQRREYSADTWTTEIRPIFDKDFKSFYISFNPVLGKSFRGLNQNENFDFAPSCKVAVHLSPKVDLGAEYYGSMGPIGSKTPVKEQSHAIYAALDLDLHPDLEFNLGTGWGLTQPTDGFIMKLIFGYRFGSKAKKTKGQPVS